MCQGLACTNDDLKNYFSNKNDLKNDWKGENPDFLQVAGCTVQHALEDINSLSDLGLLDFVALCDEYKRKAIAVKCTASSKGWRAFCVAQLTKGA